MPERFTEESLGFKAWMLLHRTRDLFFRCEDRAVSEFGLTAEQWTVLLAIKHLDDPVRPTDVGRWLGHKVNTVSMIVDRMVRAALVTRVRDLPDRRAIRLDITDRGEQAFRPATAAVWTLIQEILATLTREDVRTLIRLLETLRDKALECGDSRAGCPETAGCETRDVADMVRQLAPYIQTSSPEARRQGRDKRRK